jgi:DNA polymerase I
MDKKRAALVADGSNFLWKAYAAPFEFMSASGVRLDVLTVFLSLIRACVSEVGATNLCVVFDHPKASNFRLEDKNYKSNRVQDFSKELDSPFHHLDNLKKVLDYLRVSWIESGLAEADDIIFTLAKRFKGRVFIASSDTDFYQCIDAQTRLLKVRGSKNIEIIDERWLSDKLGVTPDQYVHFKALTGDKADNIAGISGVGPKTASKIVNDKEFAQKFKTYDELVVKNIALIKLKEVDNLKVEWGKSLVGARLLDLKNKELFEEVGF